MITRDSIPSLTIPRAHICPDNHRHYFGKPCPKCGNNRYYRTNRACIECAKYRATKGNYEYVPKESDKEWAIKMYKDGMSVQDIRYVLGCFANQVRTYLGMDTYPTPPRWKDHKRRYKG